MTSALSPSREEPILFDDVVPADLPPARLSENARIVLAKRYLKKDEQGDPTEEPETMFWRVARVIAEEDRTYGASETAIEEVARQFYDLLTTGKFEPNSPTLMNAGRPLGQLSACFVLPVDDTLSNGESGIYDTLTAMALVHQSGGGTGFGFSRIRPTNDNVRSTMGVASGPVSFMKLYDASTEVVKQGGCVVPDTLVSTNRGAVPIRELGPAAAAADSWHRHSATLHVATDEGPRESDEFYVHGVAPVRRIRTSNGYSIAATHQHRIRVIDQQGHYVWRRMDELQKGDWVVLQKGHLMETEDRSLPGLARSPHFHATQVALPTEATEELGEFIGYVIGDGAFNRMNHGATTGRLIMTACDDQPDVTEWLERTSQALFGIKPRPEKKPNDGSTNFYFEATTLVNWLEALGVTQPSAAEARVPEMMFRKGPAFAKGFLRGLFAADGSASEAGYATLSSVSPRLIEDVQQLLLAGGVPSVIGAPGVKRDGAFGSLPLHRLRVITQAGMDVFAHEIGFLGSRRQVRLTAGLKKEWEFNDTIPNVSEAIRDAYDGPGRGSGPDRGSRGADRALYRDIQHYLPDVTERRSLQRSRLAVLAERHEKIRASDDLIWFLAHDQFYDQIAEIEEAESLTLDLSVPGNHTYVANGFVSHNTRRGANMGILRADHPDIRAFINCKNDTSQVTNFNISVAVTDAFMQAVKEGVEYELFNPRTKKMAGTENAREIFDMIVEGAWRTGEPGVFFIDRANEYNPVPALGSYEATNPCVIGSTRLATDRGLLTMEELWRKTMEIRVGTDNRVPGARAVAFAREQGGVATAVRMNPGVTVFPAVPVFKTRTDAPVYRLTTTHGQEIVATDNHKFFTHAGPVELKDLTPGDTLFIQSGEGPWSTDSSLPPFEPNNKLAARIERGEAQLPTAWSRELGQLLGWLVADGWVSVEFRQGRTVPQYVVGLLFGGDEKDLAPLFQERIRRWTGLEGNRTERPGRLQLIYRSGLYYFLESLGMVTRDGRSHRVPAALWKAPREAVVGFLQGAFTAHGTVNVSSTNKRNCSVRLTSSEPEFLKEIQVLLQNFGITSSLKLRRAAGRKDMPDGCGGMKEYGFKAQYELILAKVNRDRFVREIGFLTPAKQQKVEAWMASKAKQSYRERFVTRVAAIEPAGTEDVYCTTEHHTHSILLNGLVTTQCGEQPLLPYDVCNLGSINLGPFVREEVSADAAPEDRVDWEGLRRVAHLSTHFLDNVIDANRYPLDAIHDLAQTIRRIGLGVMGWADLLVRLGIPYDSEAGVEMACRVMEFVNEESRNASEKLADGRGVFPAWEQSIWGPDETCARRPDGSRVRPMRKLRNCNLTTVAPTGTISIFAGCSGGIEPLFAVAFMRNQAGSLMPDVNPDFMKIAQEQSWYSDELMEAIATEGHIHFPEVPEAVQRVFRTAHDITPEWHVRMQAAYQEHVDSAISKTTNFQQEAGRDDVRAIYELAFDLDCKGVTVYRDGCRPNQVLSTGRTGKGEASVEDQAERAELEQLLADAREEAHRLRVRIAEIERQALDRDQTAAASRHKRQRPAMLRGRTVKMNSPLGDLYVTINEDEAGRPFEVFCTLGKAGGAAMADAEAIGRLVSLALRSGIPIIALRDQLRGISCDRTVGIGPNKVLSAPDAIGQAIERYIEEREGVQEALPLTVSVRTPGATLAQPRPAGQSRQNSFLGSCPECSTGSLAYEEGCVKCHVCGYSECG